MDEVISHQNHGGLEVTKMISLLNTGLGKAVIEDEMNKCTVELNELLTDPVGNRLELSQLVRRYNLLKSEL